MGTLLDKLDEMNAVLKANPKAPILTLGSAPSSSLFVVPPSNGKPVPEASPELTRILNLPRRVIDEADKEAMVELMTGRLLLDPQPAPGACRCQRPKPPSNGSCCEAGKWLTPSGRDCTEHGFGRKRCIVRFKKAQAWALFEAGCVGGLLGSIGVGQGKTALDILIPMVIEGTRCAVLLVPPSLTAQVKTEYLIWREHWRVPNLILRGTTAAPLVGGLPSVHLVAYSRLSRGEATVLLKEINPDLILSDEAHHLRHFEAARTARVQRRFSDHIDTRFAAWSGSIVNRSIEDYAHLAAWALREKSPVPLDPDVVKNWSGAIDPPKVGESRAQVGALRVFMAGSDSLYDGFRRRLQETRGVICTEDAGIQASLYMHERDPGTVPEKILDNLRDVRATWMRPDGEEIVESFALSRCLEQIACGFFYRWIFPRGEPRLLILEWLEARKEWRREVREKLKRREPHMDSPMLLARSAMRAYQVPAYAPAPGEESLPVWPALTWQRWAAVKDKVKYDTEAVWLDDFLARDATEWALHGERPGIVWYMHRTFGMKVEELSQLARHGGGPDSDARIKAEDGKRSIICSIKSHGEGRDGLQYLFERQLISNPPVSKETGDAKGWEQLLGRLHREGQEADEIHTWTYRHTDEICEAWERARELAEYVAGTVGAYQKILASSCTWDR